MEAVQRPPRKSDFKHRDEDTIFDFWIQERIICVHTAGICDHTYDKLVIEGIDGNFDLMREESHVLCIDHYAWPSYLKWKQKLEDEIDSILVGEK